MAATALRLAAAGYSKDPLELGVNLHLGFRGSGLAGKIVFGAPTSSSRWHCASRVVPRKKDNLLAIAEQHFLRAVEHPLEGLTFTAEGFAAALPKYDYNFQVGQTVKGVVFLIDKTGALVDLGGKAPALLPTTEASILKLKNVEEVGLFPGWEDEFHVIREDDNNGRLILSLRKIQYDLAWERCRELKTEDAIVKCLVLSSNRGGLVVDLEGLKGFVPYSHVASKTEFDQLVGKVIPLKFLEVDEEQVRLTLSNKKALAVFQTSLAIGSVLEGVVSAVKPYGAFLDVGDRRGLLHISQISHGRITDINTVLQPGDKLKVMVLSDDREKGRLGLSTKKLEQTPGDMLRNPSLVYQSAEEMARTFRKRIAQAEELRMSQEGLQSDSGLGSVSSALDDLDVGSMPAAMES